MAASMALSIEIGVVAAWRENRSISSKTAAQQTAAA
jgi:hypothetical protein